MHKHITSIIAAVIRRRLPALLVVGLLLGLVGCVVEPDSEPAPVEASEVVSAPDDDVAVDEDLEAYDVDDAETADAARRVCRTHRCDPGYICCNGFCLKVEPGARCVDRSGRDTF